MMTIFGLTVDLTRLIWPAITFVIIVLLAAVAIFIANRLLARAFRRRMDDKRASTLKSVLSSIIKYFIIFVAAITILKTVFQIDATTIIAAAGIGGIAVGLGAQNLVRDMISGMFILIEAQYQVGDRVTINNFTGTVVEIGFRSTKLRNEHNDFYVVANGDVKAVINHSQEPDEVWLDICVTFEEMERAWNVIDEAGKDIQKRQPAVLEAPHVCLVDSKDTNGYYLRVCTLVDAAGREEALKDIKNGLISALGAAEIIPAVIR